MNQNTKAQNILSSLKTKNLNKNNSISSDLVEEPVLLASSTPITKGNRELTNGIRKEHIIEQKEEQKTERDIQHIVDPNDLNEQIMNQNKICITKPASLPKYVSPLDKREK